MKIAQVAPLYERVPPEQYGGTERVVSYLTEELVEWGHEVTLFASGDSVSSANLVRCVPMALRLDANVSDPIPYYMLMLDRVRELADEFDILHFHIDQFHFPLFRPIAHRTVLQDWEAGSGWAYWMKSCAAAHWELRPANASRCSWLERRDGKEPLACAS